MYVFILCTILALKSQRYFAMTMSIYDWVTWCLTSLHPSLLIDNLVPGYLRRLDGRQSHRRLLGRRHPECRYLRLVIKFCYAFTTFRNLLHPELNPQSHSYKSPHLYCDTVLNIYGAKKKIKHGKVHRSCSSVHVYLAGMTTLMCSSTHDIVKADWTIFPLVEGIKRK